MCGRQGELHSQTPASWCCRAQACNCMQSTEVAGTSLLQKEGRASQCKLPRSDGPSRLLVLSICIPLLYKISSAQRRKGYAVWRAPVHWQDCFFLLCTYHVPLNLRGEAALSLLPVPSTHSSLAFPFCPGHSQPEKRSFLSPPSLRPLNLVLWKGQWARTARSGLLGTG